MNEILNNPSNLIAWVAIVATIIIFVIIIGNRNT